MGVRLRIAAIALAALLICAAATAAAGISRSPAAGPDPATKTWPEWPHRVSCEDSLPFDPVVAFSGPTNAERGGLPSERALRRVLASGELPRVRQHGWRRLTETPRVAEFAAGRLFTEPRPGSVSELEFIDLEKIGGRWRLGSFQAYCMPRSVRRGVRATPWALAPGQHLNPDTRRVRVEVEPQTCSQVRNVRARKPEFREQNGHLLMTLWLRLVHRQVATLRLTCPPQIEQIVVELPEKLGRRTLYDGGTYPPLPAVRWLAGG